ncbi:MAG: DUF5979 domain-containing protein [Candidatus Saccharimonadaceae bacterium]
MTDGTTTWPDIVTDAAPAIFTNLQYGSYQINEIASAGYTLNNISPSPVIISALTPNPRVTITNWKDSAIVETATITINKTVTGTAKSAGYFEYTITCPSPAINIIRTGDQFSTIVITDLPYGVYTVTETVQLGYNLTSITPATFTLSGINANQTVEIINEIVTIVTPINYGALYNYYAVNNPKGILANGWKVPTDAE